MQNPYIPSHLNHEKWEREHRASTGNPLAQLDAIAAKLRVEDPRLTKADAFEAAARSRPDLYAANRAAVDDANRTKTARR